MKKLFALVATICLISCAGSSDKVAETYFKAVVSQQVSNPDKSLVVVAPLPTDSLRNAVVESLSKAIQRDENEIAVIDKDPQWIERYGSTNGLGVEAYRKVITDRIDSINALIETVKTKEFPAYYLCSYNGKNYMYVATEDAANADDFKSFSILVRTITDDLKAGK
ncbi:MAG: hypothetical protein Q4F34_00820 [Prevotellaceae bacterium]|nr:hypothetical protein [Prevotellaceae bacterium]